MVKSQLLSQSFYKRDSRIVASDLLGKIIRHGEVLLKITETEAYYWPNDSANHGYRGQTERNRAMFGPAGHAYVYLCYGLHNLLNIVTNQKGEAAAVLIRACEPLAGIDIIKARRKNARDALLSVGPGNVAQSLGVDRSFNFHPLFEVGGLEIMDALPIERILRGPRVGIDYAKESDRRAHLRFADHDSLFVSHRKFLT